MSKEFDLKKVCFLCGEPLASSQELNLEHIFPEWILKKYEKVRLFNNSLGFERQKQKFYSHKLEVHADCNSAFGRLVETPISKGQFDEKLLWIWCLKIIVGLQFYEYGFDLVRSRPGEEVNDTLDQYPDDANTFWALAPQLLSHGEFTNTAIYSVIEIDYLFEEPNFYYHIHYELSIVWITFGARSFVVFYRSFLGEEKTELYKNYWTQIDTEAKQNGEFLPPQVRYNIFCARIAIDHYFASSGWSFDFSQKDNHLTPTRPARTPEIEDSFYEFFGLKPIRQSGKIVEWKMIPSDS